jgi:Reverse transcriptase (RNA-dependent DNA polymerase)
MDSATPAETEGMSEPSQGIQSLAMQAMKFIFHEPNSFKEAMTSDEAQLWKTAADEEISSHMLNNTWILVPLPAGRQCITSGWNFKLKVDKTGTPYRRKARFFAKGYRQIQGIDYQESFAPVVRYDSLRVIITIAAERDLELYQLDVKTAFLNGVIDEEIYIAQPEGYVETGREHEVCRLNKSIYGIKQASRIWLPCSGDLHVLHSLTIARSGKWKTPGRSRGKLKPR